MTEWSEAFALTLALELPVVLWALRSSLGLGRALLVGLGAQALTHPALWFLLPRFEPWLLWVLCAEALVCAAEAGWYAAWLRHAGAADPRRAGLLALGANVLSTLPALWWWL